LLLTRLVESTTALAAAVTATAAAASRYGSAARFPRPVTLMSPTRRCW